VTDFLVAKFLVVAVVPEVLVVPEFWVSVEVVLPLVFTVPLFVVFSAFEVLEDELVATVVPLDEEPATVVDPFEAMLVVPEELDPVLGVFILPPAEGVGFEMVGT
jgi:hypothetical protein